MALGTPYSRAKTLASIALSGKIDKAGVPLFEHAKRVAGKVTTYDDKVVAYLHDVVEDTDVTLSELSVFFDPDVVFDIDNLTRRDTETYFEYIDRLVCRGSARAIRVKLADIEDHLDTPENIPVSLVKRYRKARAIIDWHSESCF